jgi:hypothetical protein
LKKAREGDKRKKGAYMLQVVIAVDRLPAVNAKSAGEGQPSKLGRGTTRKEGMRKQGNKAPEQQANYRGKDGKCDGDGIAGDADERHG